MRAGSGMAGCPAINKAAPASQTWNDDVGQLSAIQTHTEGRPMAQRSLIWGTIALAAVLSAPSFAKDPKPSAAVKAAVADANRPEADKARDADRKPAETIAVTGIKSGEKVAELVPGGGYFTRILSKVVGEKGIV